MRNNRALAQSLFLNYITGFSATEFNKR